MLYYDDEAKDSVYFGTESKYVDEKGTLETAPEMMKNDEKKLRWDLLPFEPVEDFVKILTYGMKKYKKNNWKNGKSNADIERTFAAFMRHINSYRQGEEIDPESGLPHIYHAFADLGFILYHYDTKKKLERNWD